MPVSAAIVTYARLPGTREQEGCAISGTLTARRPAVVPTYRRQAPRTDIQVLRAVAVSLVFGYHLWPEHLPGGFVGVDVFFVISGFLITTHLLSHPPRSVSDLTTFWSRRAKRLLPASLLVLGITLVASRLVAPETQWANTARQAAASALYLGNWLLAGDSVDYLAAENAASPVQHFWSLSVEEQFYLVWPVLIGLLAWWAVRRGRRRTVLTGLTTIVVVSFGYSLWMTATAPAAAYFITPTRTWEFALGGVLACIVTGADPEDPNSRRSWRLTPRGRSVVAGTGLLGIGLAAVLFSGQTPFPGWAAVLPTAGAVTVLAAGVTATDGPVGRVMAVPGLRWLGDVSYSVYLWHWPLVVLVPYVSGRLGLLDKTAILVLTLVLAALTKRFVEDRFRSARVPVAQVFRGTALAMALVLALTALQLAETGWREHRAESEVAQAQSGQDPCLGAGSLIDPDRCRNVTYDSVVPAPAQAPDDKSAAYEDVGGKDCWSTGPAFDLISCTFGRAGGTRRVALVGNSHAGQWLPTLEAMAESQDLEVTTYLASRCAFADVDQNLPTDEQSVACRAWVGQVMTSVVEGDYDAVLVTNRMSVSTKGSTTRQQSEAAYQGGYESVLRRLSGHAPLLVLHDTPAPGDAGVTSAPDCVAQHLDDLDACSGPRATWIPAEPMRAAFSAVHPKDSAFLDLNDAICGVGTCRAVVGGVLVYSDGSHLTATYARTLAPVLEPRLHRLLAR
jgi:peptidoglycan/LPS O-acetylase OafA/YrhL